MAPRALDVGLQLCAVEIPNCADPVASYQRIGDVYYCNNCNAGYFLTEDHFCILCSEEYGEGCATCDESVCLTCEATHFDSPGDEWCLPLFENCVTGTPPYAVVEEVDGWDMVRCNACETGYGWNWETWRCDPCTLIDPRCDECDSDFECTSCFLDTRFYPEYDGLSCERHI